MAGHYVIAGKAIPNYKVTFARHMINWLMIQKVSIYTYTTT